MRYNLKLFVHKPSIWVEVENPLAARGQVLHSDNVPCVPHRFTFPKGSHRTLLLGENCKKCFYYSQTENFSSLTQSTQFSWNCRVQVTRVRILQGHPSSASKKQLYKYKNSAWWRSFFLSHHPSKRLIRSIMAHFFTEFYDLSATDISNISISCLRSWKHHLLGFWQCYRKIELL